MSSTAEADTLSPIGPPAPFVRFFGWAMLAILAAFFVNNILIVWYGFPTLSSLFGGERDGRVMLILGLYVVALLAALGHVMRSRNAALRYEARRISAFNAYLIRGCFFAVLFVGLADFAVHDPGEVVLRQIERQ